MNNSPTFLEHVTATIRPLERAYNQAYWDAAVHGTEEAKNRQATTMAAWTRFWSDPERYATARRLSSADGQDRLLRRQLRVVELTCGRYQQDDATTDRLTTLEAAARAEFYNYRAQVDGQTLSDNEVDDRLKEARTSEEARAVWEASKQVGARVADLVREMARLRNAAARAHGFRDHFQRWLEMNEIPERLLLDLFQHLDTATLEPFRKLKASIDRRRAERFGLSIEELRPWHYADRFFQDPPADLGSLDRDAPFRDQDPRQLAMRTYAGMGMQVEATLSRSDLYERPGKSQHAFCIDIDREGDVRTLNNLRPDYNWNETLLHELGHAVYYEYVDRSLPWLVRDVPHTLSTEAIALLMGSLVNDRRWLTEIAGVGRQEADLLADEALSRSRATRLLFARWCLVVTHFERALYADPDADLDATYWDLVERYQELRRPEGRRAPDWAAKVHIATDAVYYQNYELGYLITAQLEHHLQTRFGGLVNRPDAGRWLVENFFRPGGVEDWAAQVGTVTGEPLNPRHFVETLS